MRARRVQRRRRRVDPGGRPYRVLVRLTDGELARVRCRAIEMGLTEASYLAEIGQQANATTDPETGTVTEQGHRLTTLQRRAVAAELGAIHRMLTGMRANLDQLAAVARRGGRRPPEPVHAASDTITGHLPDLEAAIAALDPTSTTTLNRTRAGGRKPLSGP